MSNATSHTSDTLTNTLILALSQCEEQTRQYVTQQEIIEQLREENQRLRQDLEQEKSKSSNDVEIRYAVQFQAAFRQIAEKQGEIDHLKEKLRAAKLKARRATAGIGDLALSSPALPLNERQHHTRAILPSPIPSGQIGARSDNISPVVDKTSVRTDEPISERSTSRVKHENASQEVESKVNGGGGDTRITVGEKARRKARQRKADEELAIVEIAEDGDNHLHKKRKIAAEITPKALPDSIFNRLENLLDAKGSTSPRLLGDGNRAVGSDSKLQLNSTPARIALESSSLLTPRTDARPKRPESLLATIRQAEGSKLGQQPLRSKSADQLRLIDFKVNSATNLGLEYAYNETIRGEERKCLPGCTRECCINTFRALAATLPGFSGPGGQRLSDHDLLLDYLGPGSEAKIKDLAPKARENLVHEARTKLVANAYGKMHRDIHERGRSPPGFWRTDMPGSQEAMGDRNLADLLEKEEVKRRYQEAMRAGGRWIFADE